MRLAEQGTKVVLCGVYENKLQETMQSVPKFIEAADYLEQIYTESGMLDGFVHCAGISLMRPLKIPTYESVLLTIQTNFFL